MNIISYPLRYLALETESGKKLYRRDSAVVLIIGLVFSVPYILTNGNFFGEGGFFPRIGSFVSILAGFYIAALVGVASLSNSIGDLDKEITTGPILLRNKSDGGPDRLTRRQYVCSLFGYLAFSSLVLSLLSSIFVILSEFSACYANSLSIMPFLKIHSEIIMKVFRGALIFLCSISISHMFITTLHGLYYYIDKIYHKETEISKKDGD